MPFFVLDPLIAPCSIKSECLKSSFCFIVIKLFRFLSSGRQSKAEHLTTLHYKEAIFTTARLMFFITSSNASLAQGQRIEIFYRSHMETIRILRRHTLFRWKIKFLRLNLWIISGLCRLQLTAESPEHAQDSTWEHMPVTKLSRLDQQSKTRPNMSWVFKRNNMSVREANKQSLLYWHVTSKWKIFLASLLSGGKFCGRLRLN